MTVMVVGPILFMPFMLHIIYMGMHNFYIEKYLLILAIQLQVAHLFVAITGTSTVGVSVVITTIIGAGIILFV